MLVEKVFSNILENDLLQENDRVLVALSGGADSICLLNILKALEKRLNLKIYTAHLNHQIRNVDAHEDALFSYRESKKLGIRCFLKSFDVVSFANERKITIEESARIIRYKMLFDLKKKLNIDKIAVAHNLDDQCETVLMRILRGTGLNGLKGMSIKREDGIIRPLLNIKRSEIEDYCHNNKIPYKTDHTNFEDIYTRNSIRLNLIPYIEKNFSPNIKDHIFKMSKNILDDSIFIEEESEKLFEELAEKIDDCAIKFDITVFDNINISLLKRLFIKSYTILNKSANGLESIHLDDILKLIDSKKTEAKINLPNKILVQKEYNYLIFTTKEIKIDNSRFEYEINLEGITYIPELNLSIESKIVDKSAAKFNTFSNSVKSFDYEKIEGKLIVRNRREGDKIRLLGSSGSKKVKDLFIDKKIQNSDKDRIPIILDDNKILWVCGLAISDETKITESTKKIVRLRIIDKK